MISTALEISANKKLNNTDIYDYLTNNLLLKVQKPAQYLGIEWGHLLENTSKNRKDVLNKLKKWEEAAVRTTLIYPDIYELGMSNFGTKILYEIINSYSEYLCDRAYAPMSDMEELLRKENIPLWGWETFKPLSCFDLLGISLSYELSYTNVLNMLELSGIGLRTSDRKEIFPLVFAGGPAVFNPEPMADFIDFFIIGDGEEVIVEILELVKNFKNKNNLTNLNSKDENLKTNLLLELAQIEGIYVPNFYEADPDENYLPKPKMFNGNKINVPEKISKRMVGLTRSNQPTKGPIPYLASVQDRQVLEIRRGCDRGCRFCQPGYVYLPVRERTPEELMKLSTEALKNTGYDEYSFLSLSASDYTCLHEAAVTLNNTHASKGISLSMPSQRADRFDMDIANELNTVRKSGITLAPEAGTERLRAVINKGLKEHEIKRAIENVYSSGFHHVKLYFMIGLPTETYEDLDGIIELLRWAYNLFKIKNKKPLDITCTISTFVPKAFTPFQWFSQNTQEEFRAKISYLKSKVREYRLRTVKLNYTDPKIALLEAVLSRGDRRMSELVYRAYKRGAKFDAWDDRLNIGIWNEAGNDLGIDLNHEAIKHREVGSVCPWYVIDSGLLDKFLIDEFNKAISVNETPACTENKCHACGVCFELDVFNEVTVDKSEKNKFVKVINSDEANKSRNDFVTNPNADKNEPRFKLPVKSVQKIEIVHTKKSDLKFISHLDLQRVFERAMRRANIPFAFTEGFNPRPKMQWLMPLPLFYESGYEMMHLELSEEVNDSELQIMLNTQLPPEMYVKSVKTVNFDQNLALPENVKVLYKILTYNPNLWEKYTCKARTVIESFLAKDSEPFKIFKNNKAKNGLIEKEIDIRPLVERVKVLNEFPFEVELLLTGSTRAELVLDYFVKSILPDEEKNEIPDNWQLIWKIKKEEIYF